MEDGNRGSASWRDLLKAAAAAKSLQSCPTLCDLIDGSPPGYPVPGILQARTLKEKKKKPEQGIEALSLSQMQLK